MKRQPSQSTLPSLSTLPTAEDCTTKWVAWSPGQWCCRFIIALLNANWIAEAARHMKAHLRDQLWSCCKTEWKLCHEKRSKHVVGLCSLSFFWGYLLVISISFKQMKWHIAELFRLCPACLLRAAEVLLQELERNNDNKNVVFGVPVEWAHRRIASTDAKAWTLVVSKHLWKVLRDVCLLMLQEQNAS